MEAVEPPQHLYAETGRNHFLKFLAHYVFKLGFVWYPSPPVCDVSLLIPETAGGPKWAFVLRICNSP